MKKKLANTTKSIQIPEPWKKWQFDAYARHADFRFVLPYQFLLLCKLMHTTPDELLSDFMDNLACDSWRRQRRDRAKEYLVEYFLEHRYGQD